MFDDNHRSGFTMVAVGRNLLIKVGLAGAMVGIVGLLMLAPFGTQIDQASANCLPAVGRADDPRQSGAVHEVQIAFAKLIDQIAIVRGLPGRATLVAIMTALQESQLQNLNYGDRDSLGLFQQRPSAGWGTPQQILDPAYAIDAFFGGDKPPNPPGLVDINGWTSMSYTEAAQAVQQSAYPDAYARHEQTARDIAVEAGINLDRPGDPYAGRSGPHPADPPDHVMDGCGGSSELIAGEAVDSRWPPEQQNVPDPTGTGGYVTPRTAAWVAAVKSALGVSSIVCWDAHAWNPSSDHPRGKACDVMVGSDARRSPQERERGNAIANWAVQTAGQTGVHYVIWYGQIWSARRGQWIPYNGGGIYDPNDANGGHYNHVHVSLY
ncbi:MAG TPA: hypothetical protein VGJ38_17065 [Jatrophihabitantaceae bacterium]